ncbi:MAG: hypothetical protein LKF42_08755 [Streptococcaceae bacterium]|jgi:multidrug efflux pump subunit AcrB|nr:hypothetical protein [Streptococcaceae bacterium]MCH4177287.1 hypothetical protein [Streptococcaceae bacterium]
MSTIIIAIVTSLITSILVNKLLSNYWVKYMAKFFEEETKRTKEFMDDVVDVIKNKDGR